MSASCVSVRTTLLGDVWLMDVRVAITYASHVFDRGSTNISGVSNGWLTQPVPGTLLAGGRE
jgi:hypothetical protein